MNTATPKFRSVWIADKSIYIWLHHKKFFFFFHFRSTPVAYGSSQARGQIKAAAANLPHSHHNARSKPHLWPKCSSRQCWILNPLSEARDQTCILTDINWVFCFGFFVFCLFRAAPAACAGSQANQSYSCQPTPQSQKCQIWAASVTYSTAHGNTGSLTQWARPGIEPTTSWFLIKFVSAAP